MNSAPIALRLVSGSRHALQPREEALLGVDGDERHLEVVAEGGDDLLALVLAHQPVVDEDARQLVADRAVHEQRGDARVDAARQAADDLARRRPGRGSRAICSDDDALRAPRAVGAADLAEEALEDRLAVGRVDDLGMKLDAVDAALDVLERGDRRAGRRRQRGEARRRRVDGVAVRHPAGLLARAGRRTAAPARGRSARERPNSPISAPSTRAAELGRDQLHAVADAEHRDAELEQLAIQPRRAVGVDRRRAAGQDQALRLAPADLLGARRGGAAAR